jgi:hypothetical protein
MQFTELLHQHQFVMKYLANYLPQFLSEILFVRIRSFNAYDRAESQEQQFIFVFEQSINRVLRPFQCRTGEARNIILHSHLAEYHHIFHFCGIKIKASFARR